jgi:hypothetical protein
MENQNFMAVHKTTVAKVGANGKMHNPAKKWAKIPNFSFLKPKILANLP